jgi:hypothetical protein
VKKEDYEIFRSLSPISANSLCRFALGGKGTKGIERVNEILTVCLWVLITRQPSNGVGLDAVETRPLTIELIVPP